MSDYNIYNDILKQINLYLHNNVSFEKMNNGLYSGKSGILLYLGYNDLYKKENQFLKPETFPGLSSFENLLNSYSFSNGLAGDLLVFSNLQSAGLLNLDSGEISQYNTILLEQLFIEAINGNWDNIHGSFGILYSLLKNNSINEIDLSRFLQILKNKMFTNSKFIFYKKKTNYNKPEESYNLGLSHGISGHIIILCKAVQEFPTNTLLKNVLEEMVSFLLQFKRKKPINGYFPTIVKQLNGGQNYINVRVAWCYGDLGPGIALYRFAEAISDSKIRQEALEVLIFAANRRGLSNCYVVDAPLCHGTAGNMHIFTRLFYESGIEIFKSASDYWLNETVNIYLQKGLEGFSAKHLGSNRKLMPYLLEGLSGIGLAILSKSNDKIEPKWDSCLFLS